MKARHRPIVEALWIGAVLTASSAQATLDPNAGAETAGFIADLNSGGGQNNATVRFDGGAGIGASSFLVDDAVELDFNGNGPHNRGLAQAEITVDGVQTPILRGRSILTGNTSGLGGVIGAAAVSEGMAAQRYVYTGGGPLQVTFTLSATVSDPTPASLGDLTWVSARVGLWETTGFQFLDSGSLFEFGVDPLPLVGGGSAVDFGTLFITDDTGGMQDSRQVIFDVNISPGTEFYLLQELDTSAREGTRSADAFSTLSPSFTSGNVSVVPEPSTWCLLALAGGMLLLGRRRSRPV